MGGNAIIVKAKPEISGIRNSLSHGTGRKVPRSEARNVHYDFDSLRKRVYIPGIISDEDIWTENPNCYNDLESVLATLKPYIDIVAEMKPKTVVMQ
jgi:RNA-splicing ligase RtcB